MFKQLKNGFLFKNSFSLYLESRWNQRSNRPFIRDRLSFFMELFDL